MASTSAISFYSLYPSENDNHEYNFCSQKCLDEFFRDRIKFNAIVRNFDKKPRKSDEEQDL